MSTGISFINDDFKEVSKVLKSIKPEKLYYECQKRGLPYPVDSNKFLISFNKKGINLCYKYFENPSEIMELLPNELPSKGWIFSIKKVN
ncbi:MAG: hypothetical protein CVU03_06940 [Bacteroidetes bacterium HGW-Bacteroidetes-2]|jgi:hypothetical protein|nr:MAG: hypothetical protein CVU03_06940 [Bacteroidetes bacterium HGW-Bacteroidetes-2]